MGKMQGIQSKNRVEKPVKVGVGARGVNTRFVSRVGASQGNKATEKSGTIPYNKVGPYDRTPSFKPVPLGNSLVNNVGQGGPGKGRDMVMKSGQQKQWGSRNPGNPARKNAGKLFPGF